ncbi:MAG TPA: hypothetical protein VLJ42_00355 [Solirubrobacteraceae bacterium]|nr:hypothetical protein [Solirubrobacteraceae bacterium]
MSNASEALFDLVSRPLSPNQILERKEAEQSRAGLMANLNGQLVEYETQRVIEQASLQRID